MYVGITCKRLIHKIRSFLIFNSFLSTFMQRYKNIFLFETFWHKLINYLAQNYVVNHISYNKNFINVKVLKLPLQYVKCLKLKHICMSLLSQVWQKGP